MSKLMLTAIIAIGLVAGCAKQEDKNTGMLDNITIAAFEGDISVLVYFAQDQGYFRENGLDVNIKNYTSGKLAADILLAGEADISTSSLSVLVSKSFDNTNLRILGTLSTFQHLELIARKDKGVNNLQDIKGKKLGLSKGSSGEFGLGMFLIFNNISIGEVEIVDLVPTEIVEAITKGKIDASFTWEPFNYNIKMLLGENAISWSGQQRKEGYFLLLTMKDWLDEHPQAANRFLKALVEAESFATVNPNKIEEYIKNKFNYEDAYLRYVLPKNRYIVTLSQAMILALENNARWRIQNNLTRATQVPNYLNYIYADALNEVKPNSVTIIR